MSGNRLWFDGLNELRQELRKLPQDLTGEARHEILAAANSAAATVKRGYPAVTGHLRDGVSVEHDTDPSQFGAGARVINRAPHAWWYDNGTQTRRWTKHPSHKSTGAMFSGSRPTHLFVSTMIRERRAMYQKLKAMLVRKGLIVDGDV